MYCSLSWQRNSQPQQLKSGKVVHQNQVLTMGSVWEPEKQVVQPFTPQKCLSFFPDAIDPWQSLQHRDWWLRITLKLFLCPTRRPEAVPHSCLPHSWEAAFAIWGPSSVKKWQPAGQSHQPSDWLAGPAGQPVHTYESSQLMKLKQLLLVEWRLYWNYAVLKTKSFKHLPFLA